MPEVTSNCMPPIGVQHVKRARRSELSPRQVQILDWIENFIVPALVEKYIQEQVLNREANRG
jgi:hypothetical protein